MNLSTLCIIGAGHVGLVYAAGMAELGHRVWCVDTDEARIARLNRGELPIFEPGLDELVERNSARGTLTFTTSYDEGLAEADFVFIAVSTPSTPDGAADLRYVRAAARSIGLAAKDRRPIIVNKSTVPVGTGDSVDYLLAMANAPAFSVVSNPEFLREGTAVYDFFNPDRIVLGSRDAASAEAVASLYGETDAEILITDVKTAEMIKYASNAFLATKISFINEIAQICDGVGADPSVVAKGMGLDPRVGPHFLKHGLGFGGSCLPKDVRALSYMATVFGAHPQLLNAVLAINSDQRRHVMSKVRTALDGLHGARVCVLGLAFKPDTDDVRDAPSMDLMRLFVNEGVEVHAYDPQANAKMRAEVADAIYYDDPYDAAAGCDAIILATEWAEFRVLDLQRLRECVRTPVFIDGRHVLDPTAIEAAGFDTGSGRVVRTAHRNGHAPAQPVAQTAQVTA